MKPLRLALALGVLIAPLAASTPHQRKQEAKAAAAKRATEQKKQHRETVKALQKSGKKR